MFHGRTPLFRQMMKLLLQSMPESGGRRRFLKQTAMAGAGLMLPSCATTSRGPKRTVAIVGGGIAGLTAAWRLMNAGHEVHLYETRSRTGGRMFTRRNFNDDGQFVELGAELVDTNHKHIIALAKELGVKMQNLRRGEQGRDFVWLEERLRTDHDIPAAFKPLGAKMEADADGLYDAEGGFTDKARELDRMSLAAYLKDRAHGVEPWVIQLLIAAYEPELGARAERQSCLNLVDFINPDVSKGFEVFGDSDEAWRIEGGNDTLPTVLLERMHGKISLHLDHRLEGIADKGGRLVLKFGTKGGVRAADYERVILAIPFTVLRGVPGVFDLPLTSAKKRCIREMGYGSNVKVFRSFKHRLWRDPVPGRDFICNGSVFAMEPTYQNVWETSRGQPGSRGIITNLLGGRRGESYSEAMMSNYLDELDAVFPGLKKAHDGKAAAMNWPKLPFALGSYSCPFVGQYTWIYDESPKPDLDGRLVFAGEHTSTVSPGFMNGGVESGERAAREAAA
ncbi:MAG: NAD(P)/FAD-dependent oxidoreductase [Verrucomicrobiaceae bacterium]